MEQPHELLSAKCGTVCLVTEELLQRNYWTELIRVGGM